MLKAACSSQTDLAIMARYLIYAVAYYAQLDY